MLHPERLPFKNSKACQPLLKSCAFKPYEHHADLTDRWAIQQLFLSRMEMKLRNGDHAAFWIPGSDVPQGLAGWTQLAWDSEQLGVQAGRLDYLLAAGDYKRQYQIKEALLERLLEDCAGHDVKHLVTRVHASDLSSIHLLEQHGFVTLDGILTFALDVENDTWPAPREQGFDIRLSRPEDIQQIKAIARSSYVYDRFHSDPRIPKATADELHAVWLENSCTGSAADAVVVAAEEGRVLGYVTCKIDRGTTKELGVTIGSIVLVATAPDTRGQGMASATTYGALDWFQRQGVDIVEVGTQLRNIPASRLYESCGFRLVTSSLSLRKWIE